MTTTPVFVGCNCEAFRKTGHDTICLNLQQKFPQPKEADEPEDCGCDIGRHFATCLRSVKGGECADPRHPLAVQGDGGCPACGIEGADQ